jgi:ribonuclease PH
MTPIPTASSGLLYSGGKLVRAGGRAPGEMRPLEIIPGYVSSAEGSALIQLGKTRVVCTASVEDGVPPFLKGLGQGWITSEYAMIPRATQTRTPREATRGRQGGRTMEIQRLIGRSLRAVTNLKALGERSVWIDCDVLRADGGTRTASITGAMVAMGLAFQKLVAMKIIPRLPLHDYVAALSAGFVGGEMLLDLDYAEDSNADMDMNVVMTGRGQLVEVQATAEGKVFGLDDLHKLVEMVRPAIQKIHAVQQALLKIDLSSGAP